MLRAILNKSRRQHPTKPPMYGHLPPIAQTVKVRQINHVRHHWRSKDEAKFFNEFLYMNTPMLANQQKVTFISPVWTLRAV